MAASLTARRQIHETYSGLQYRCPCIGSGAVRSSRRRGPSLGAASAAAGSAARVEIHRSARRERYSAGAEIHEDAQRARREQERPAEIGAAVATDALGEDL